MASQRSGTVGRPKLHLTGFGARPVKAQRIDDFEEDDGGAVSDEAISSSVEDDDDDEDGEEDEDSSSLKNQETTKIPSPRHSSFSSSTSSDSESEALPAYQDITFGALAAAAAQQTLAQPTSIDPTDPSPSSKSTAYKPPNRPPGRSSKHAPQALTSKRPVGRSRTIIKPPVVEARDPRFSSLSAGALNASKLRQNYAFLTAYEDSEMAELKKALTKTKKEEDKEALKRALGAMRNRRKADEDRARREEVEHSHRRNEKELVEQGKKPFFLKRADVREKVLTEKFEAMKGRDVKRTLERRARKKAQRERRGMPDVRRGGDG